jgi:hypothetical protein
MSASGDVVALLSETWLEVEPIIYRVMRKVAPQNGMDFIGIIDYEVLFHSRVVPFLYTHVHTDKLWTVA